MAEGVKRARVLLLDDDPQDRLLTVRSLSKEVGDLDIVEVTDQAGFDEALGELSGFNLVITDYQLKWTDGLHVLRRVKERDPELPVVMFTATGSEEIAVEAMKNGLDDYILKSPKHFMRLAATVRSILHRREREAEMASRLRRLEEDWKAVFNALGNPAFVLDNNFNILEVNAVAQRAMGCHREDLVGKRCYELMHLSDEPPPSCPLVSLLSLKEKLKEGDLFEGEMYVEALDRTFWVTCSPVLGPDGRPERYIHMAVDITPRKELENRLREVNERLRTLIDASPDFIIFKDGEGRWIEANESALKVFKLPRDSYRGKRDCEVAELTDPVFRDAFLHCQETNLQAWERGGLFRSEEVIPGPYGTPRTYDVIKVPIFHEDGRRKALVVIGRDITELKEAEREKEEALATMAQAQKMEAMGVLAGGIAHEFNNVLTAVLGYIELAQLELPEDAVEAREYLERSQQACDRAVGLTRQMLFFSRKKESSKEPLDLNSVVQRMAAMLERLLGEDVAIRVELEPRLWVVEANEGAVEQAIMNLALNARDAMPNGGTLMFKTENVELTEAQCKQIPEAVPGRYARLTVWDSGEGIEPELLDKIFDPFFTTKEVGKGTGLGLSVVYGMVRGQGGCIEVESEKGRGTAFHIYLPAGNGDAVKGKGEKKKREMPRGAGETVLVVEDEEDLGQMLCAVLDAGGYTVRFALDCREAREVLESIPVDFAVIDLSLPDGNGEELAMELLQKAPNAGVVLVSGYALSQDVAERLSDKGLRFMKKPFKREALLSILHQMRQERASE